jgi:hypothetical protein
MSPVEPADLEDTKALLVAIGSGDLAATAKCRDALRAKNVLRVEVDVTRSDTRVVIRVDDDRALPGSSDRMVRPGDTVRRS